MTSPAVPSAPGAPSMPEIAEPTVAAAPGPGAAGTDLSFDAIRRLSARELVQLFRTLEAPSIEEMNGEYRARLLRQPGRLAEATGRAVLSNPLASWLCKAFRPNGPDRGRGYNTFRVAGRVVQRFPMQTQVAPSRYDERPAYQLIYGAYRSLCGNIHMVDEVRRLREGVYLGIGTWGFSDRQRRVPLPFLLEGPAAPYRGDIGTERVGFVVGAREIPALGMEKAT